MIFILGKGGRAKLIKELILRKFPEEKFKFFGNFEKLNFDLIKKKLNSYKNSRLYIGISDPFIQNKYYLMLKKKKLKVDEQPLIDPSAIIKSNVKIGKNTFILENSVVGPDVKIGKNVFIGSKTIINHDCKIGNFTTIGHGSNIAGNVKIMSGCLIGISSTIKQNIKIEKNVIVGSASNIVKNCKSSKIYYGNPALEKK